MAIPNTFTTGDQYSVMVDFGLGDGPVKLPRMTKFTYKQNFGTAGVDAFVAGLQEQTVHKNWSGTVTWADTDTTLDDVRMAIQNAYQAGVAPPQGSISIQKTNPDGSKEKLSSQTLVTWKPTGATTVQPTSAIMNSLDWSTPFMVQS